MSPITPLLLGAGVDGAADTGYSLEAFHLVMLVVAEQSQKVMVRRQLSRRRCCKPRNPKMGYHLGSQDLVCHLSGLPSLHPANLTSETQFICYGEANQKLMLPPVHFLPTQSSHFRQTLSVKRDHLDLFFWALLLDMTFLGTHQLVEIRPGWNYNCKMFITFEP